VKRKEDKEERKQEIAVDLIRIICKRQESFNSTVRSSFMRFDVSLLFEKVNVR